MWRYDADVDPSDTVANLAGISGRAENMRPVFTVIRELMLSDQRRNFESRGSVFGSPWPDLAPGSLARKSGGSKPLVLTGTLEKAATGGTGKVTRITKSGVTVGINQRIHYARFHQAGAKGGRKGDMPKREVVGINRMTREKSLTLIQKYLVGT